MKEHLDKRSGFHFDVKWVFILLILAFLLVFLVFPLLYLLFRAFFADGSFSLDAVKRIYSYSLNWDCLRNTLITASLSMVFGVLIAFPLAWLVTRTNLYGRGFFRTLFLLTYMVPPYVGAMAWMRLLNPKVGTVNVVLKNLFGLSEAPFNIYTIGGMVWVLTTFYYPFAFILLCRALERMDPSLEEAARISGASPVKTLFTVTLPMMLPSIGSSAIMVFVPIHHRSSGEALYHYYKDFGICGYRYLTGIVGCHRAFGISDGTVSCIAPPFEPFDEKEKPDHDQWKIHAAEHCGSTKMADPTDDPDIDLRDRDHRDPISFGDRHFLHTEYGKVCLRRGEPDRQILAECLHPFDDP